MIVLILVRYTIKEQALFDLLQKNGSGCNKLVPLSFFRNYYPKQKFAVQSIACAVVLVSFRFLYIYKEKTSMYFLGNFKLQMVSGNQS